LVCLPFFSTFAVVRPPPRYVGSWLFSPLGFFGGVASLFLPFPSFFFHNLLCLGSPFGEFFNVPPFSASPPFSNLVKLSSRKYYANFPLSAFCRYRRARFFLYLLRSRSLSVTFLPPPTRILSPSLSFETFRDRSDGPLEFYGSPDLKNDGRLTICRASS